MTELETLDNIYSCGFCVEYENCPDDCLKGKLKDEAVKWVNSFRKEAKFEGIRLRSSERDLLSYVFKHFFNLTDEDLKE